MESEGPLNFILESTHPYGSFSKDIFVVMLGGGVVR